MTAKRLTRAELTDADSLGAFKPVDHVVLAFADEAAADRAAQALRARGCADEDLLALASRELRPLLERMLRESSGAAGFGYEVTLMRRFIDLATEDAGWLVVYAPGDEQVERVRAVARAHGARVAVRYGRLVSEELIDPQSKRGQL